MSRARRLTLSPEESQELQRLCNAHSSPQAKVFRARIILRCAQADDPTNWQVAVELGCHPDRVCRWRRRFAERRRDGLEDLPRSGRPKSFSP